MQLSRDNLLCTTSVSITDEQAVSALHHIGNASDLVAAVVHLISVHGDLPVWASDHSSIDLAWFRASRTPEDSDDRLPDCIMIG